MIDKGIQRIGKPIDAIERSMEIVGKLEMYKMEKNLVMLSVIARIAPLFGFVGTIVGLVILNTALLVSPTDASVLLTSLTKHFVEEIPEGTYHT